MREKKHVLMITPRYRPSVGGVEKHVEEVVRVFLQRGISCDVMTTSHRPGLATIEKYDAIRVFRFPFGWNKFPPLIILWLFFMRSKLARYQIVHVHDAIPLLSWYPAIRILMPNVPIFVTYHGFERDPIPGYFKVLRKISRYLVKGTICIGSFIKESYGVRCDFVSYGGTSVHNESESKRVGILFVGRLEEDTGVRQYMSALLHLREAHGISIELTVCGSGSLRTELERISKNMNLNVNFLGVVEDLAPLFKTHRYSFAAGYLSLLEAMSFGLPVLSIASSPLKHRYLQSFHESGAPISLQSTPEGIAEEIKRLMERPELEKKISKTSREFASEMSWTKVADYYMRLWKVEG